MLFRSPDFFLAIQSQHGETMDISESSALTTTLEEQQPSTASAAMAAAATAAAAAAAMAAAAVNKNTQTPTAQQATDTPATPATGANKVPLNKRYPPPPQSNSQQTGSKGNNMHGDKGNETGGGAGGGGEQTRGSGSGSRSRQQSDSSSDSGESNEYRQPGQRLLGDFIFQSGEKPPKGRGSKAKN